MLSPSNGFHNRHLPDAPHRSCRRQTHGYRHHGHNYQASPHLDVTRDRKKALFSGSPTAQPKTVPQTV